MLDAEDKKTTESDQLKAAQSSRSVSRGKGLMPNIKVVSQPKKSPLLDIVIDLEETFNPLGNS
jgi:3-deoxy-D-manno-octulosonic acid (KDO) 8-phosphate synthase